MSDSIEEELSDLLGNAEPRGAGFSERMAAGARQRLARQAVTRRLLWSTGIAAASVALALLWFLPARDSVGARSARADLEELPAENDSSAAGGGALVPTGPVLLVFDVQPEGEAFVDGMSVGSTRKPVEVAAGAHLIEVKIGGEAKIHWSGTLLPGQWKRFSYTAPVSEPAVGASRPAQARACDEVTCLVTPDAACCQQTREIKKALRTHRKDHSGTLNIIVQPWGKVYIDGKLVGQSPVRTRVAPGRHKVTVMRNGGWKVSKTVRVEAGGAAKLVIPLGKDESRDAIVVDPFR